jgi:hypothetical protein
VPTLNRGKNRKKLSKKRSVNFKNLNFSFKNPLHRFFFVLFIISGVVLSVLFIPWSINHDNIYNKAIIILDRPLENIDSFLIKKNDYYSKTSEKYIPIINLTEDWSDFEEIIQNNYTVILTGVAPFFPEELANLLDKYQIYTGFLEFDEDGEYIKDVLSLRNNPSLIFRVHTIKKKEYPNYDIEKAKIRFLRSVRERSIDAIYIQDTLSENIDYSELVTETANLLEENKYLSSELRSPSTKNILVEILGKIAGVMILSSVNPLLGIIYIIISFISNTVSLTLLAILGQYAIWKNLIKERKIDQYKNVFTTFLFSLLLGLSINSQISGPGYENGIYLFRGVKLSLIILPLYVFIYYAYQNRKEKFKFFDIIIIIATVLGGVYYLLRSGNYSFVLDLERNLRDLLDTTLLVRPRFKDIISYPFLLLFIRNKFKVKGKLGTIVPTLGSIAIASNVNTFCHSTSPLWTELLRSFYGFIFGFLIGIGIISLMNYFERAGTKKEIKKSESSVE